MAYSDLVFRFRVESGPQSLFAHATHLLKRQLNVWRGCDKASRSICGAGLTLAEFDESCWRPVIVDVSRNRSMIQLARWTVEHRDQVDSFWLTSRCTVIPDKTANQMQVPEDAVITCGPDWMFIRDLYARELRKRYLTITPQTQQRRFGQMLHFRAVSGPISLFERIRIMMTYPRNLRMTKHAHRRSAERELPDSLQKFDPNYWWLFAADLCATTGVVLSSSWETEMNGVDYRVILSPDGEVITWYPVGHRDKVRLPIVEGKEWDRIKLESEQWLECFRSPEHFYDKMDSPTETRSTLECEIQ